MSAIDLEVFGDRSPDAGYIGWSPVPLVISGGDVPGTKNVVLNSRSLNGSVTRIAFMEKIGDEPSDEVTIDLGAQNRAVIFIAGKYQAGERHNGASADEKDVRVEVVWADRPNEVAGYLDLMIRARKNANQLSEKARKDFLTALATLNGIQTGIDPAPGPGKGIYVTDFVGMHVRGASQNQHGDAMFLPWHRLYLLDLERLLQQVNPAVTLPYWRFDQAAPNVFTEDFMGATVSIPTNSTFTQGYSDKQARFASTNPLSQWRIGNVNGIQRAAFFDTLNEAAPGLPAAPPQRPDAFRLLNQMQTLALGGNYGRFGNGFSRMEGTPPWSSAREFQWLYQLCACSPPRPPFLFVAQQCRPIMGALAIHPKAR